MHSVGLAVNVFELSTSRQSGICMSCRGRKNARGHFGPIKKLGIRQFDLCSRSIVEFLCKKIGDLDVLESGSYWPSIGVQPNPIVNLRKLQVQPECRWFIGTSKSLCRVRPRLGQSAFETCLADVGKRIVLGNDQDRKKTQREANCESAHA